MHHTRGLLRDSCYTTERSATLVVESQRSMHTIAHTPTLNPFQGIFWISCTPFAVLFLIVFSWIHYSIFLWRGPASKQHPTHDHLFRATNRVESFHSNVSTNLLSDHPFMATCNQTTQNRQYQKLELMSHTFQ